MIHFAAADQAGTLNRLWGSVTASPLYTALQDGLLYLDAIWTQGVFGVSYGAMITASGFLLGALLLRGLFARWVLGLLRAAAKGTRTRVDDALIDALSEPIKLVFVIVGLALAIRALPMSEAAQGIADRLLRSLVAVAVFWALHRVARSLRVILEPLKDILLPAAVDWIVKSLQIIFLLVGAAAVLEIWGVRVAPLLAGLGIFGVAVALGAQDLFKNLIAGIAVLMERRFRKGDWIKVEGVVEGVVEEINFRSTVVRRFDDGPVYVPNASFSDNAVINFSRMGKRRIYWTIGLEYGTTIAQLQRIRDRIEQHLLGNEAFVHPPQASLFVHVEKFADSSIDIMIYCFTKTIAWGEWLAIKEAFALEVKQIVESEGAAFAFPSRSIYITEVDSDAPPGPAQAAA
ncbi:MAG: mechanosensitive ion channel [Alphaproteobacteria bacterium]|nr:mechanosensitive ion channel [Alphaproteobacteria bacterium]